MFSGEYLLYMLPGLLLGLYAQFRLTSTYNQYIRVGLSSGVSGADAAREILDRAGLQNVPVNVTPGHLTDHYDPTRRALFLSEENYYNTSVAAVGVAAHEAGHALQHAAAYAPLHLRMTMVPLTNFATQASFFLLFGGMMLNFAPLVMLAIGVYAIIFLFQLITLPVEYDASRRAKQQLANIGLVRGEEAGAVGKVLNAAALTYVAAMVTSLMTLLYYLSIFSRRRDD